MNMCLLFSIRFYRLFFGKSKEKRLQKSEVFFRVKQEVKII